MPTFIDGQQNLSSLQVPGVYIDIIPPQPTVIGSATNFEGLVGVGSWGPVNAPQYFSTPDQCSTLFGTPQVRDHDIATHVWAASQVGGSVGFVGVRVTDGTDVAATGNLGGATALTLTAKHTGTLGNSITATIGAGTAPNSYSISISFPGKAPEVFNNITGTGNAFWVNAAAAINNGSAVRGASTVVVAAAGASITAPTVGSTATLAGGSDGATGVVAATLMGVDTTPRTGMYALRRTGIDCFTLIDLTDSTTWAAQASFALSENCVAVGAMAKGTSVSAAIAARVTAGLDAFQFWLIAGDWPTFYDSQNGYARLVAPTAFALGLAGNLSPEQSPLNKPLNGVVATQASQAGTTYSDAELALAEQGGIDLIVGPPVTPGGSYFTFITGRNASSNTSANGIEYSRLTFFLARSLQSAAAGKIVGSLQSIQAGDQTRMRAKALVDGFLAAIKNPSSGSNGYGMIDDFSTQCDLTNNPASLQQRGFLFLYAKVLYLNAVRYFVVKLAGGGNVQVSTQQTAPSAQQFL